MIEEYINDSGDKGHISILQLNGQAFHERCLSSNSISVDNTGLRLHGGTIVAIRFLRDYAFSKILTHMRVLDVLNTNVLSICELGCGTGVFGLLGTSMGRPGAFVDRDLVIKALTLTDGNEDSVQLARENYQHLLSTWHKGSELPCDINFSSLTWGSSEQVSNLIRSFNNSEKYNIIIGSELMYYRTDMNDLVDTVLGLAASNGDNPSF